MASWRMVDAAMSFGALVISDAVLPAFEASQPSQARYKLTRLEGANVRGVAKDFAAQQDYVQAAHWYRKAAELGDAEAAYQMNTLYREGRGVPKDLEQAEAWLAKVRPLLERVKKRGTEPD
jgi:TPR repeat protein